MPDLPNPIAPLADSLGSALAGVAATAFDTAMKSLWDFAISLLAGVFAVVDHLTAPNLDPGTGPLSAVLPATLWIGGVLLALLCLLQIGKAALTGGAGLVHLAKGIAQYVIVTAAGLGLLAVAVTAANAAAIGILTAGLQVSTWSGIAASNTAWTNAVHGISGAGLGLIALLGVLPAAITLLVTVLVREAAILVIAATVPILAAGLVAEATARWFWTALRWLLALVLLTPAVALVMALGLRLAAGASGATAATDTAASAGQSAVTAFVGAGILLVSVFCPLALFKLFAFVDPGTASGQRLRTSWAGAGAGAQPGGASAASQEASSGGSADGSNQVENRWSKAVTQMSVAHHALGSAAEKVMSTAAPVLAAAGVGEGVDHGSTTPRQGSQPQTSARGTKPAEPTGPTTPEPPLPEPPTLEPPTGSSGPAGLGGPGGPSGAGGTGAGGASGAGAAAGGLEGAAAAGVVAL